MFTKFASYKVPPVMVSTHGSVVPLAMFVSYVFNGTWLTFSFGGMVVPAFLLVQFLSEPGVPGMRSMVLVV